VYELNRESNVYNMCKKFRHIMKRKNNYLQRLKKKINQIYRSLSAAVPSTPKNRMKTTQETWTVDRCWCGAFRCRTRPVAPSCIWTRWPPVAWTSGSTGSWRRRTGDIPGHRTGPGTSRSCSRTRLQHRGKCPPA